LWFDSDRENCATGLAFQSGPRTNNGGRVFNSPDGNAGRNARAPLGAVAQRTGGSSPAEQEALLRPLADRRNSITRVVETTADRYFATTNAPEVVAAWRGHLQFT